MTIDVRAGFVNAAHYYLNKFNANHATFVYSEGPDRMTFEGQTKPVFPIHTDCSGFVTLCALSVGMADPNGENYNRTGYTGTLLAHNQKVPPGRAIPGDVVIYGPGTGWHAAIVVAVTNGDILTISHGGPTGQSPCYAWVTKPQHSVQNGYAIDGRTPQTFLRLNTTQVRTPWVLA